ncbi:unnamed protein product [Notodromas monacha]|uniref:Cytochrome c oxidase subunit 5B, mitochondrial n=1 Tax=Notodromas monacha TaxID=399045 RepID=A0A7R9BDW4_9CRUS|nr:unnamed protein product [Notodromas monacha]CAG0912362.1 unnamed protein product [Notodromas monacha]
MALSMCTRVVVRTALSRSLHTSCALKKDYTLNDPFEHATGREKLILQAEREGNPDPFNTKPIKRGKGTKDEPTKVPSFLEKRIVGCVCDDESMHVNWMWLEKGHDRRCACGYWFQLTDAKPLPDCAEFKAIPIGGDHHHH